MDSLDTRLDVLLHRPGPAIADDGFSEGVMHSLPTRKLVRSSASRWTLGGGAVAGALIAALLGAPLESAFSVLAPGGSYVASLLAVLFVAVVAISAAWVSYSE
jgi:hypothetical protein